MADMRDKAAQAKSRLAATSRGRRGDRKDYILEVAQRLFVEKGSDTTMSDIATEAGIAEGTVYLYFASKRELIIGVASYWSRQMLKRTLRQLAHAERVADKLSIIIQNHLTFMLHHSDLYFLFFREIRTSPDYASTELHEVNREYTEPLKACLIEAVPGGISPAGLSASQMRDMIYGSVEHVGWAYIVQGKTKDANIPTLSQALTSTYMRAFGIEDASPSIEARLRRVEEALGFRASIPAKKRS